ncbi:MAG: 2-oxoglutarate dehydrogenase complex dihydrolipoyllysine-residue succinyltransferase [Aeoliella sp.]
MASTIETKSEELRVPEVGESISEVVIGQWHKQEGDSVQRDEELVELESEKATFEAPSPVAGVLTQILKRSGDAAEVGEVIAYIEAGASAAPAAPSTERDAPPSPPPARVAPQAPPEVRAPQESPVHKDVLTPRVMPAAARALDEQGLKPSDVEATGRGGRVLKEDVLRQSVGQMTPPVVVESRTLSPDDATREERKPMSPLRKTIASRLVEAQKNAALLTTFNEADLTEVKQLRKEYGPAFEKKHGVKLGFMAFFVKAAVEALKNCPELNARIDGDEIVYQRFFDIGIAIGVEKGLVVPILRDADKLGFAEIEHAIADFATRAKGGKLTIDEMLGGTFTISNGGVYGSLLSTPIVNPPQSGVLGMHTIQERPVAIAGNVVIRPMMYLALTYDHRMVDGREAVTFLREIKEAIEEPARILIEI